MKDTTINSVKVIEVPKMHDVRGSLVVIEKDRIPFTIKRVYYLYDVPSDSRRGGHAHKNLIQFMIPISGSFEVVLDDGTSKKRIILNKPNKGLLITNGIWRELDNFSSGAVCLVLASDVFDEEDYIRDYDTFVKSKI